MTFKDFILLLFIAAIALGAWIFWDEILQHLGRIGVL